MSTDDRDVPLWDLPAIPSRTPSNVQYVLTGIRWLTAALPCLPWVLEGDQIKGPIEEGPHFDHVVQGCACAPRRRVLATVHGPKVGELVLALRTYGPRTAAALLVAVTCLERLSIGEVSKNGRGRIRHALSVVSRTLRGD